ncbi:dihydroneopterin aldolase [Bowmanella sp. JS7-9]|uniref:dihydroneopterin aldolase n=1 Tax=Alteromonadaceae TaxID=72275 RepID=UPI00103E6ABD|nr:dihydroneopterin aldolase [Bowmanella sp. JS7-9]TBX20306.1 hypothetical protein TK45_15705 [Bowmanella sp. JS7-9]
MDKIIISGLQVESLIGVYEWEREAPTSLLLDVEISTDLQRAADSDNVADTIDYAAVAELLMVTAKQASFELLEALAGKLIDTLFSHFPVQQISMTVIKPGILPTARQVAVMLTRSR